jgi:sugar lactone lactonase YvrE
LTANTSELIVAFPKGFAKFNPAEQSVQWICQTESELATTRLNDGRVDRQGRFWSGSMDTKEREAIGSLYCLQHGAANKRDANFIISNGLCWNLVGDRIYHVDSPTRVIKCAEFNSENGQIGSWQVFATTPSGAYPDGACVDMQDCLWSAQWGDSCVRRYSPKGELLFTLKLPCKQPSCVAFGGDQLDYLFVTSAHVGLPHDLLAKKSGDGNMFVYKMPYSGVEESLCIHD